MPNKPKVIIVKSNKNKRNHVWIRGHWKWGVRKSKYVCVKGIGRDKLLKTYVNKLFFCSPYRDRCFVNLESIIKLPI